MTLTNKNIVGLIDANPPKSPEITEKTRKVSIGYGQGGVRGAINAAKIKKGEILFKKI